MVEIVESAAPHRGDALNKLREKMGILMTEWGRLEVCEYEVAYSPFLILTDQVERSITECGLTLDRSPNIESIETMGDGHRGMHLAYCSQGILVITSFRHEHDHYEDGEEMVTSRLDQIRVVDLDDQISDRPNHGSFD